MITLDKTIGQWLSDRFFIPIIEWCLKGFMDVFSASLNVLQTEVTKTPVQFSPQIVNSLRAISTSVIMPIAGIILAYVFCYELINMLLEKNNMADFDTLNLFKAIFKTFLAILLVSNCFDITLAFFDVGQQMISGITPASINLSMDTLTASIVAEAQASFGMALVYMLLSIIIWLVGAVAVCLIYLIAWSRIITILIYISVAPIPFATLMNKDWIGGIGQNYIKNLMAYALQGFLMMVCMMIYGGLLVGIEPIISNAGNPFIGSALILVAMFVCIKALMSCLHLAKSVFGAA